MESLIHIYLSNGILCVLLGLYFLLSNALKPLPARLLGVNYLLYAVQSLLAVLVLNGSWPPGALLRPLLALALGPALYLYYTSVGTSRQRIEPRHFIHFAAVPLVGLVLLYEGYLWLDYLIIGSFSCYLAMAIYFLSKGSSALGHLGHHANTAYRWLSVLAILMAINLLIEMMVLVEIQWGIALGRSRTLLIGAGFFLLVNAMTVLLALRRTPLIEWMNLIGEDRIIQHLKPQLGDEKARELFDRFEHLVASRQLHKREEGLTVKQAAQMLTLPARHLSESVNRIYGSSFSQYLNDRRVDEARRLIESNTDMAITDVMLAAGFSTKSNFNKEFSRVTGMAPSEYRKRLMPVGCGISD